MHIISIIKVIFIMIIFKKIRQGFSFNMFFGLNLAYNIRILIILIILIIIIIIITAAAATVAILISIFIITSYRRGKIRFIIF